MSSPSTPLKHAIRFCGSCLVTLACWALWIGLSTTLVALSYIIVAKELPVPGFVLRRAEARLAGANLYIQFGRASFDPTGKILLEDVAVRMKPYAEPLITSRLVFVRRNLWSALAGQLLPDEIRLEGATLQLPAMISPSGTVEPLIRDLALTLRHEDNLWQVDLCTGRIGQLAVTANGVLSTPARPAGAAPLAPEEIAARFLQMSRALARKVHQLDDFDEPSLVLRFDSPAGVGNTATLLFTARAAHQPWGQPVTLGSLAATATLRLDDKERRPLRLLAAIHHGAYRGDYTAENVRAIFLAQLALDKFSLQPLDVQFACSTLTAEGEQALGPVLHADLSAWPDVTAEVAAQIKGEFLAAEVSARLREQSARLHAEGRGSPDFINSVLKVHTPRAAPFFNFGDPVTFRADAVLNPGWKFSSLSARVSGGRLDSRGVKITALRGRIDLHGSSFLAHDARVEMGDNLARGSYWMDFGTTDYRMLLDGRLRPMEINGWFAGEWWRNFWNNHFAFPGAPPTGEVDLQGRWRDPTLTTFFGRAAAQDATVWHGEFEQARAVVFLRPNFTHGLAFAATRAGGGQQLTGSFRRFAGTSTQEPGRFEFNLDSNADPAALARMLDGHADDILANLKFNQPPRIHAEGRIGASPEYTFHGQAEGGLYYFGFPLDTAQVAGTVQGPKVRLDPIEFTTAGGRGQGRATVDGPADARRLGFDVSLKGADLARTIRAVEAYQFSRTKQKSASMTESKFMKRASGGRLDLALAAEGRPGDLPSFTGAGTASLTGTELAEIQLFGALSQLLSGLSLKFSSLKLDTARTSFTMAAGRLHFPDLKISGPSAVIDAHGDFTFENSLLDFTAKFKPFEESRNPLTAVVGLVINPITSFLDLKLKSSLSNPNWTIFGDAAPAPETPPPSPPPPAGPPPAGEPEKIPPAKG
ncbi:MAG: AsmA-like C-terminal region-containing protein [Opitutae bacterium]